MKDLLNLLKSQNQSKEFDAIRIGLASPDMIRSWSFGEVKKPETINYRTFKPERDGLFCAKIFGPIKDYECLCGKYKRLKHRGVICEKCGVEVALASVRRERMGHIELASPVAHIWFLKSLPSRIGLMLDMTLRDIERVLYFESFIVIDPGMTTLEKGQLLNDEQYYEALEEFGDEFDARMGAEAVKELLEGIDLQEEVDALREEIPQTNSETKIKKFSKRLKILEAFLYSGNKPGDMVMTVLPVLPPDLRPLVPLDGGRFATSDLNDLYRRVINRNNRLKRLLELNAPDIIVRNEKRMLQEAVDALLDNGRRGRAITGTNKRPLKSLADMIKGKQGRFRQNLLGKRVDYSGRSVIVVGPYLRLHQCGLPKKMALELFKPFIFSKLEHRGLATTIKAAKKMVEREEGVVWDILDEVIREHPIMLNRAPTLHRLGIQAFEPVLIEGKAIQLHPLVCAAYNADFDGDQMAVHVPLTLEAQLEARALMMSTNNVLSPANGEPIIVPSQDVVLGLYYMTRERKSALGEGMVFADVKEAHRAYGAGKVDLQAIVKVRVKEVAIAEDGSRTEQYKIVDTTVGRALLFDIVPDGLSYELVNKPMVKKAISNLINTCYRDAGLKDTVIFADQLMYMGYHYATVSGISIGFNDFEIPPEKYELVDAASAEVKDIETQYASGLLTQGEKYNKVIDIWSRANDKVSKAMMERLAKEQVIGPDGQPVKGEDGEYLMQESFNSVYMMADSGARGSAAQIRQLAGMRGLMAKPDGSIIETPITANFREGLNVLQYFISTHGARKGLADTALKTANSGYLTRRLVDVSQDLVVTEPDCGTDEGLLMTPHIEGGDVVVPLGDRVLGRVTARDAFTPTDKDNAVIEAGTLLDEKAVETLERAGVDEVWVRSAITCETRHGICSKCYGRDLARGHEVNVGEAVGVIAAQSIGEPGTQLTMRTFHIGGAASRASAVDNIQVKHGGTVRLHNMKSIEKADGTLVVISRSSALAIADDQGREREWYKLPYGAVLSVKHGDAVEAGVVVAKWDPHTHPIIAEAGGTAKFVNMDQGITVRTQTDELTGLSTMEVIDSKERPAAGKDIRPAIQLIDEKGEEVELPGGGTAIFFLPANALVTMANGARIELGDVVARIPQESSKTRDITGGLPRVADLFEARRPKESSILAEISGMVSFGKETKGKKRLVITPKDGDAYEVLIPKHRQLNVFEGETVEKGEVISDGPSNPHDILRLLGVVELAKYITNEIQDVYRLQGVVINDKHIEVIVRQMLRKVEITDPGDTTLLSGDQVEITQVLEENEKADAADKEPARFERLLLGITKASLATESFISAASFQETTRVLTEGAVTGKRDYLRGLKENVVVGRLIPAGTGLAYHNERRRKRDLEEQGVTAADVEEALSAELNRES
ncbi:MULTISPECIES: DNA-directed RNA polymerase subunit beta' [Marinobacter]|jgi:DNA-directed RNA polymerase subunit beta'|uniref:DNA-directed RNA polymerase subunit beta' n=5 Tax=Marinobacter TaxID=2742 RepID=A0A3D8GYY2_9GAMM|nr:MULTISPECIES: DNA-directed RNA polymerase subunit beta' [Marinobacter]MCP4064172.1 DNA-directed RNA polymerase subunit beta' [Gammaproteobacteria bacterium]MCR9190996.1 DNA-directed RNA polymerase subunit beta' [Alteromonadaceae bacterium]MEC7727057.1 DNA-directed RNA polymerase subunit beta' [Pseudomonadota bacterium]ADP96138.1 DNA-directed RNA polymerase subunit beta [Marinobacter adhaerens HP15]AKV97006.1 DNA-directed RNA polymerase subunit beta' [Marinobacter sp. CP1]|tara:strand:- start:329 stop:4543 length:4215 start_codon:yes stop_codon:yes gene_type:complete|eukprot:TRINITY_DN71_c0_g1_i8.p1 TRINITY_DN71_c0_g1~~TRINITY_DN71_c0_g1_i8.p1  ORF type:complete len:1405 (-),score=366.30 TRINITY_DN71_c0_g1_i8:18392-22606(-)